MLENDMPKQITAISYNDQILDAKISKFTQLSGLCDNIVNSSALKEARLGRHKGDCPKTVFNVSVDYPVWVVCRIF
jgi:hypothetical protein